MIPMDYASEPVVVEERFSELSQENGVTALYRAAPSSGCGCKAAEKKAEVDTVKKYPHGTVSAILTDIEGTTTPISFVQDVLFPYAKAHVGEFLLSHLTDPAVLQIIEDVKGIAAVTDLEDVISTLLSWMQQDKKITSLKSLQGMMWEEGYKNGDFQGNLYTDAYLQMRDWKNKGLPLYVYSSGSVKAQKLLFGYSNFGDTTPLFSDYFDTKVGSKKEAISYVAIAQNVGLSPQSVLFLSDSIDELKAAQDAGMQTLLLSRDSAPPTGCSFSSVKTFNQIDIE